MSPKVSVIIPNYNHARYLNKRIDSVLNQTFQDFELIILDDKSTDDSKEIISQYSNRPKVSHIVFNDTNSGSTFKQWQKGLSLATGEWIWFAESDDYCEPTLLENLINNTKHCDDVVLSYCQSYYFEDGQEHLKRDMTFFTYQVDAEHWKQDYCNTGEKEIAKYLLHRCTIPNASAVIFRKDTYEQVDKSFVTMKLCGDWMLWIQLLKAGNIAFCAKPLNYFRAHGATTRSLDTLEKRRRRASEEYLVALNIQKADIVSAAKANVRLTEISQDFMMSMRTGDMLRFLLFPSKFESAVPYIKVLSTKIKNLLTR